MSQWPSGGTGEMFTLIQELPEQLKSSLTLSGLDGIQPLDNGVRRILLCGMGGSAIAGDLVAPLLMNQTISLDVWRDYDLPHWVDNTCLIIVASYSGNTEESLSALVQARELGCPILGITSGGQLAAAASGVGGMAFPMVELPGGLPPRASLGFGLGALVGVLGRLGLVANADQEIQAAAAQLQQLNESRLLPVGQTDLQSLPDDPAGMVAARELARQLVGRIPVIYTAGSEAHGAGVRLKGQINENSKSPACLAVFPELNHNDLVGWELPDVFQDRFVLLVLQGELENDRVAARVGKTTQLLTDQFPHIHFLKAAGETILARVLSLVQYGDYLSCHLAHLKQVDPVPVDRIGELKSYLESIK